MSYNMYQLPEACYSNKAQGKRLVKLNESLCRAILVFVNIHYYVFQTVFITKLKGKN